MHVSKWVVGFAMSASALAACARPSPAAVIFHVDANELTLNDGELLLIDAGAEYRGYASDITRTFPINGRFTKAQRDIYDLVLETQMACVEMVRPGTSGDELKNHSIEMLTEGMVRLGLLQGDPKKLIEEEKYNVLHARLGTPRP